MIEIARHYNTAFFQLFNLAILPLQGKMSWDNEEDSTSRRKLSDGIPSALVKQHLEEGYRIVMLTEEFGFGKSAISKMDKLREFVKMSHVLTL